MDAISGLFEALDASPTLLGSSVSCMISPHQSFHFTISCNCSFSSTPVKPPPPSYNNVYALFLLPVSLFVDRYELEQRFVDGDGPRAQVWGETNLELPVASPSLNPDGSAVLLTLQGRHHDQFHMPLHARYLLPVEEADDVRGDIEIIDVPLPKLFTSNDSISYFNASLQSSVHTLPHVSSRPLQVRVPVGQMKHLAFVEPVTMLAILACFIYVASAIWRATRARRARAESTKKLN